MTDRVDRNGVQTLLPDQDSLWRTVLEGGPVRVQTVNLHHVALAKHDAEFAAALAAADYVTADGWPIVLLFKAWGHEVRRTTGSVLVLEMRRRGIGKRMALIGATPEAGARWEQMMAEAGAQVVYRNHDAFSAWNHEVLAQELAEARAELVLVAATPPKGDVLAHRLHTAGVAAVIVGVGGAIDMLTGQHKMAPGWIRHTGTEWLFRLLQEPKRLATRYLRQDLPAFFTDVLPAVFRGLWGRVHPHSRARSAWPLLR